MISSAAIKAICIALVLAVVFGTGWHLRGTKAERDMLAYQNQLADDERKAQAAVAAKRQADAKNLSDSTSRVDTVEKAQQVEVHYVDREVIKYRDRPVAGKCVLPAEWVRLYNQSGRAPGSVPGTSNP